MSEFKKILIANRGEIA
ncbi:hypothetical protein ATO10_00005, partial [Actibacterium atlanticum]